jgi:hypothetical protein
MNKKPRTLVFVVCCCWPFRLDTATVAEKGIENKGALLGIGTITQRVAVIAAVFGASVAAVVPAFAVPPVEPDRAACDEIAVIGPQFAAYGAEMRGRNIEEELRELNDWPTDYDQAMYLRQMLRWDANIFQRAALEAEDPVLHGKLLDNGNSVADVDDLIDDRIDKTSLGAPAPAELHTQFEDAMGIAQDAYGEPAR